MKLRNFRRTEVSGTTVSRVSELILRGEPLTRRELAESANVSVMTAGKIVDAYREAGLLEETAELTERGRSPRLFRLSPQAVAWGILRVEERGASLTLVRGNGELLESQSLSYDEAMSPEDNETVLRGRWHALKNRIEDRFAATGLGVILREGSDPYWERAVLEGIGAEADILAGENELTARILCSGSLGKTVLHLRLDREIQSILAIGKEWTVEATAIKGQKRYERLTEKALALTELIQPDCIVAESHGRYAGDAKRFLRRLEKEGKERDLPKMPALHTPEDLTLSERAMTERLTAALAREIGARMGK